MQTVDRYKKNYNIRKGDSKALGFTFADETGDPIDLTGWRIGIAVKVNRTEPDADALILKTNETHGGDPANGTTSLELSESDTDIPTGIYHYSIRLRTENNEVKEIIVGILEITDPVRGEI